MQLGGYPSFLSQLEVGWDVAMGVIHPLDRTGKGLLGAVAWVGLQDSRSTSSLFDYYK
jgi:hypothetical protein